MGITASPSGNQSNASHAKIFEVVMVLLAIFCPLLLIGGNSLTQYKITEGQPLYCPSFDALPGTNIIRMNSNVSLDPGTTINKSIGFAYDTTPGDPVFVFGKDELLMNIAPMENDLAHGQRWYVFIGFIFLQSMGSINWTVYGPKGDLIDRERIDNATLLGSAYYLLEAHSNGTYLLTVNNVGQSQFSVTISLGFAVSSWSKPYFYAGAAAIILGIAGTVSLAGLGIVAIEHNKRIRSTGPS